MVRADRVFAVFVCFVGFGFAFCVWLIIYQANKIDRLESEKARCYCPFLLTEGGEQNVTALRGVDIKN